VDAFKVVARLLSALIVVIHNRMTFAGDTGIVMMWLWEGLPDYVVAALAAMALLWVIDTMKPTACVVGLAALYLYGGGLHAWQILRRGWHAPPSTADYIGILLRTVIPALTCLIVGIWWMKRSGGSRAVAT
jgi:hypothetical protein